MGLGTSMDLEPHEVERMDCNCQEADQGGWTMAGSLEELVIQEHVLQVEDETEDCG